MLRTSRFVSLIAPRVRTTRVVPALCRAFSTTENKDGSVYSHYINSLNTHLKEVALHVTRPRHESLLELESNARTYSRDYPLEISRADGISVYDKDDIRYYDALQGAGANIVGHNNPVVKKAIMDFIEKDGLMQSLDLNTTVRTAFVEELYTHLPASFAKTSKIQFCSPSGSDAVEASVKLAKTITGRHNVICFHGSYHGSTNGTLSMSGNIKTKAPVDSSLMSGVHFMPYPFAGHSTFGINDTEQDSHMCEQYLENVLNNDYSGIVKPACVVIEVVQGEGGVVPATQRFLRKVREITEDHGIILIVDEIQTGFGRTGNMFAFEDSNITPDMVVLSKGLGGGLPLSCLLYNEKYDAWLPGAHAGTFRGNQMAMVSGTACMKLIREKELLRHSKEIGEYMKEFLNNMQHADNKLKCVTEVRGSGCLIGVEITHPFTPTPEKNEELARAIRIECFRQKLLLQKCGRDSAVLKFLPPLTSTRAEIEEICNIFERAVLEVEQVIKQ